MAKLNKTSSGLLYHDDFSEQTLMWSLSPSDANCISFGDNGLQIKHNENYVSYTIVEPSIEEYSCVVKLDHIPQSTKDIGGVIIMSDAKGYAECQSYVSKNPSELVNQDPDLFSQAVEEAVESFIGDSYVRWSEEDGNDKEEEILQLTSQTDDSGSSDTGTAIFVDKMYPYIKFTKIKYKYIFSASEDGYSWIDIGNVSFESSSVIGFFLYSTNNPHVIDNSHFFVNAFAIYNSKYMTIEGIDRKQEFEIFDENGQIMMRTDNIAYAYMLNRSNKTCLINTTTLPIPIRNATLRIYPKNDYDTTISSYNLGEEVYGGDSFTLEREIKIFIDNQELSPLELYELGTFYRGSYFVKFNVFNNEDYRLSDIKVKVIRYSEYYGGEEAIGLALYDEERQVEELVFEKEVIIDTLSPHEGCDIFMKLIDKPVQDFYMTANDYRFKIIVE